MGQVGSKALFSLPLAVPLLPFPKMLAWPLPLVLLLLLPKIFAVPLVLLLRPPPPPPKIFDAPPLLLLPNIKGAPLLALLARMLMEALPPLLKLLPALLLKILVEFPLLLADLAGSLPVVPLELNKIVLDAVLPDDDP